MTFTASHNAEVDSDSSSTISTDSIDWREFYIARNAARQACQARTSANNPAGTHTDGEERGNSDWTGIPPPGYDWDDEVPGYDDVDLEEEEEEGEYDSRGSVKELVLMVLGMVVVGLVVGLGTGWAALREREGRGGRV